MIGFVNGFFHCQAVCKQIFGDWLTDFLKRCSSSSCGSYSTSNIQVPRIELCTFDFNSRRHFNDSTPFLYFKTKPSYALLADFNETYRLWTGGHNTYNCSKFLNNFLNDRFILLKIKGGVLTASAHITKWKFVQAPIVVLSPTSLIIHMPLSLSAFQILNSVQSCCLNMLYNISLLDQVISLSLVYLCG